MGERLGLDEAHVQLDHVGLEGKVISASERGSTPTSSIAMAPPAARRRCHAAQQLGGPLGQRALGDLEADPQAAAGLGDQVRQLGGRVERR